MYPCVSNPSCSLCHQANIISTTAKHPIQNGGGTSTPCDIVLMSVESSKEQKREYHTRLCLKNMNIQRREKGRYNQLKTTIQDHQSFEELHQIDCQHFWRRSEASTCVYHYSLIRNIATGIRKANNTINSLNTMYLHMLLYKLPCLLSRRANA